MTGSAPPRIPIDDHVARLWGENDAAGFLRAWMIGELPQGAHVEHTGNRMVEVPEAGHVVMEWTPGPQLANLSGAVHGGYLALVCDEAAGLAAASAGERFVPMLTLDLDTTYLRPAVLGAAHRVEGRVLHRGRQRMVSRAEVFTPAGKVAVTAQGSFIPNQAFVELVRTGRS
jgi:uncharacterized protein (TIGR00369 family)